MRPVLSRVESVYLIPSSIEVDFSSSKATNAWIEANPDLIGKQDEYGRLPIHIACTDRNASFEAILLLYKAYPGAIRVGDRNGNIPLHYACIAGHSLQVIQALLSYCMDTVSVKDKDGRIALHYAYIYSSLTVISKILESYHGAAQMSDKYGNKPSYYISFNRSNNESSRRAL